MRGIPGIGGLGSLVAPPLGWAVGGIFLGC
jgi:hypothetical protein